MVRSEEFMYNLRLLQLRYLLRSYRKVLVAYSGGVDSTFLLKICVDVLGGQNVIAATAVSEAYTAEEMELAKRVSGELGVKHMTVHTSEMVDGDFIKNGEDRCYHCKRHFFNALRKIASDNGIAYIIDGSNVDDDDDYRPGRIAAAEYGIKSPLSAAGLTKDEIRRYSRMLGLRTWNKPASPCLASRIPYGEKITREKLATVEKAEHFLRDMGFPTVRVRHHGRIARIEIPPDEIHRLFTEGLTVRISNLFKSLGFTWVTVDIEGYRQGSMNEVFGSAGKK